LKNNVYERRMLALEAPISSAPMFLRSILVPLEFRNRGLGFQQAGQENHEIDETSQTRKLECKDIYGNNGHIMLETLLQALVP
jgi:hypothetical protein